MNEMDPIKTARELATHANDIEHLQAAKDAKASALAKLTALGLTQAEVTALIG